MRLLIGNGWVGVVVAMVLVSASCTWADSNRESGAADVDANGDADSAPDKPDSDTFPTDMARDLDVSSDVDSGDPSDTSDTTFDQGEEAGDMWPDCFVGDYIDTRTGECTRCQDDAQCENLSIADATFDEATSYFDVDTHELIIFVKKGTFEPRSAVLTWVNSDAQDGEPDEMDASEVVPDQIVFDFSDAVQDGRSFILKEIFVRSACGEEFRSGLEGRIDPQMPSDNLSLSCAPIE